MDTGGHEVTESLASFVVDTRSEAIPSLVRDKAVLLLLDAIGTAIGNRDEHFARAIRMVIEAGAASGTSTAIGSPRHIRPDAAAELNSVLIHGSDLDATHIKSIIHPTAIGVPVALATAEEARATADDAITALTCGMEVLIRLGLVAGGEYHPRGFQATSLLGPVVGAFIAARLYRRGVSSAIEAAGLATSIASGLRSFSDDGTWGKRLITGWACRAAIHADELIASGYRGSRNALEKQWGLYRAFLPESCLDFGVATRGLSSTWHLLDTEIKRFPCSHGIHPFIEAALDVRARVSIADIAYIGCRVNEEAARWWFEPMTLRYSPDEYSARFSMPYTVAKALIDGEVTDQTYTASALNSAEALDLTARVRPIFDEQLTHASAVGLPGSLRIQLRNGETIDANGPEGPDADEGRFVINRFRDVAIRSVGPSAAAEIEASVLGAWGLPDVRLLTRRLS